MCMQLHSEQKHQFCPDRTERSEKKPEETGRTDSGLCGSQRDVRPEETDYSRLMFPRLDSGSDLDRRGWKE